MKFTARCSFADLSLERIKNEVNAGLQCLTAIQETFQYGDSEYRSKKINTSGYYIEGVFERIYDYVVNANWYPVQHETEFMDAVGFVQSLRITVELYSFDSLAQLETLIVFAAARAKIDSHNGYPVWDLETFSDFLGHSTVDGLSISEVALLAHMDEKSVRNATQMQKQDRLITQKNSDGVYIKAEDALDWLKKRQGFKPTKPQVETITQINGVEYVLVPKAFDGTTFRATCKLSKGYKVGEKDNEEYFNSIWDALEKLKKMRKAYWRRPNEKGISGIVSVHEWVPITKEDFLSSGQDQTTKI